MLSKVETLKLISNISKSGKKLDNNIQEALISCVYYSVCHGDWELGQKLIDHFPSGSRKSAAVAFLEEFGQYEFKAKTMHYRKNAEVAGLLEDTEASEAYCAGIQVHWTAFKPEAIKSAFNDLDFTKSFIAKLEKEAKAGHIQHAGLYMAMVDAYTSYMDAVEAEEETELEKEEHVLSAEKLAEIARLLRAGEDVVVDLDMTTKKTGTHG